MDPEEATSMDVAFKIIVALYAISILPISSKDHAVKIKKQQCSGWRYTWQRIVRHLKAYSKSV